MTGFFIVDAAKNYNPQEVKGLDGALLTLARQPYGKVLLTIAALGIIAFATVFAVKGSLSSDRDKLIIINHFLVWVI